MLREKSFLLEWLQSASFFWMSITVPVDKKPVHSSHTSRLPQRPSCVKVEGDFWSLCLLQQRCPFLCHLAAGCWTAAALLFHTGCYSREAQGAKAQLHSLCPRATQVLISLVPAGHRQGRGSLWVSSLIPPCCIHSGFLGISLLNQTLHSACYQTITKVMTEEISVMPIPGASEWPATPSVARQRLLPAEVPVGVRIHRLM